MKKFSTLLATLLITFWSQAQVTCTPVGGSCNSNNIVLVKITGTSLNKTSSCGPSPYTVFPDTLNTRATVRRGTQYALNINTQNSLTLAVWIDWDGDKEFTTSEQVVYSGSKNSFVGGIVVPTDAQLGKVRMRVRTINLSNFTNILPCAAQSGGETEDYWLTVIEPSALPIVCRPASYGGCTGSITRVTITGTTLDNSPATSCTLDSLGNSYITFPSTGLSTGSVRQGSQYALTVWVQSSNVVAVWVDWNGDNEFMTSEMVLYRNTTNSTNPTPTRVGMKVPIDAPLGQIRMRVRMVSENVPNPFDPCGDYPLGETEDYILTVKEASPDPVVCRPGNYFGCGLNNITRVSLAGTTLNNQPTNPCSFDSLGNAYNTYASSPNHTGKIRRGSQYALTVNAQNNMPLAAWVDWNADNVFSDNERIFSRTATGVTLGLKVPVDASFGPVRLRVRSVNETFATLTACSDNLSGETEDYILTVIEPSPEPLYCRPGNYTGCFNNNIRRVAIAGTTLNNAQNEECTLDSLGNAYITFPATGNTTGTIRRGSQYGLTIVNQVNDRTHVYIDWNRDRIFQSNELVYNGYGGTAGLVVPIFALPGQTRMRVRTAIESFGNDLTACGDIRGETEDYTLTVIGPSPTPVVCRPGNYSGCIPSSTINNIRRVRIIGSGLDNNQSPACTVDSLGNNYITFPASGGLTGKVRRGSQYAIEVEGPVGQERIVWIDWNGDNVFSTTEIVYHVDDYNSPAYRGLKIPMNAVLGKIRMRVRSYPGFLLVPAQPCNNVTGGETEDYFLTVLPPSSPVVCVPGNYYGCVNRYPHYSNSILRVTIAGTSLDHNQTSSQCSLDSLGNSYITYQPAGNRTGNVRKGLQYVITTLFDRIMGGSAWIDWNQDFTFSESERVELTYSPGTGFYSGTIAVPLSARLGQVRMRIRSGSSETTPMNDPCSNYSTGETEDYFLTVLAPVGCNSGIFNLSSFVPVCVGQTQQINPVYGTEGSAGRFYSQPSGLGLNEGTGQINPSQSQPGIYNIYNVLEETANCPADTFFLPRSLKVYGIPEAPVIFNGALDSVCQGDTILLKVINPNPDFSYAWNTNPAIIGPNALVTPTGAQVVYSVASRIGNCVSPQTNITVKVNARNTPVATNGSKCGPGSVQLSATGAAPGGLYNWYVSQTSILPFITGNSGLYQPYLIISRTFYVSTINRGCEGNRVPVTATILPIPEVTASAAKTTICSGQSTLMSAASTVPNTLYSWLPAIAGNNAAPSDTTDYILIGNAQGCEGKDTIRINVKPTPPKPTITADGPVSFCTGGSVNLTSSADTGNVWSTNAKTPQINVTQTGSYTARVVFDGCTSLVSDPVVVTRKPIPTILASTSNPVICQGQTTSVNATSNVPNTLFTWVPSGPPGVISPLDTTVFVVTGDAAGCIGKDTIQVQVKPTPPKPIISLNVSGGLHSNAPSGNQWFRGNQAIVGATDTIYEIPAGATGIYYVQVTWNGCKSLFSDTITIVGNEAVLTEKQVHLSPNPFEDRISLISPVPVQRIELFDLAGKGVFAVDNPGTEISPKNLPKGVYTVRLKTRFGTYTRKLIKN